MFSRYFFAVPLRGKHKDFTLVVVKRLLEQYEKRFGKPPDVIQFDEGGELKNTRVLPFLRKEGIECFSTRLTSHKAAVVERANRSLKTRMWLFFNHEGKKEWIYVLDDLVESINTSVNRGIGMAPVNVTDANSAVVFTTLYGKAYTPKEPKFGVGDRVLISNYASPLVAPGKKTFKKGYKASFRKEVYTVEKVSRGDPNLFSLEGVMGRFYAQELTHAP